jgi:cobalamin-dependent methionine synthase I
VHVLDPVAIEVPRPMVLMRLGYRRPAQVPERTARLIDEVMERGRCLLAPKAVYGEFEVDSSQAGLTIIGKTLQVSSRSLRQRLAGCARALVFAATVGPAVEEWGRELMDSGQMTRGLLADAYGSSAATALGLAVEAVAARHFRARALEATRRYAPGYGDWALSDQTPLLSLIEGARIGIRLTLDHLMLPAKSISGVIGGRE